MMLHGSQSPVPASIATQDWDQQQNARQRSDRKRKAETQDNERLSKRLSLLNIEQNGSKLYVPVETPLGQSSSSPTSSRPGNPGASQAQNDDTMHVDDSKHKVYIYNLDDELSDDSESDDGKLVFLPDIERHLKANRIPPQILANADGELAGMQMVLYNDPKSLSVPEEKDSVRKAIVEARNRLRKQQKDIREGTYTSDTASAYSGPPVNASVVNVDTSDVEPMDMD